MPNTLDSIIKDHALDAKIPFDIDFKITLPSNTVSTKLVGGFEFPVFNELLTRESWFFDVVAQLSNKHDRNFRNLLRKLALKCQMELGLSSIDDAVNLLLSSTESNDIEVDEDKLNVF
ncbi:MAG: hypothetical protein ACRDBG_11190, partial [Waterburya sp.]